MRQAILVTGLKTEPVRMGDKFARYYEMPTMPPLFATDGELLMPDETITVTERIVPITQICYGHGKPNVYVAYSHEVEEILGIPFQVVLKEKEQALTELNTLRNLSAMQLLKKAYRLILATLRERIAAALHGR